MKFQKIYLTLMTSLVFVGCSTAPVSSKTVGTISDDRIYEKALYINENPTQAKVTFKRDGGFFGSGCSHDIYINNVKAFSIRQNEQTTVYLNPSDYLFRLETGAGLCPNVAISQETTLKPNQEAEYRILLPSDGSLRMVRSK